MPINKSLYSVVNKGQQERFISTIIFLFMIFGHDISELLSAELTSAFSDIIKVQQKMLWLNIETYNKSL